ncbi:D-hexose-6-phosphate mutarotase [Entomospira entomophila]|uniref:Putative glucose-6-phosphate 1-epimerase n=1 Tax=Entomospira entomophila TaxID=2719988 RepID=A0A968GC86_9SPIO|nr:D-hexose-6-phosphate mutarotase [Entomospira entomophilus]NIZ40284.1 D-hexose-6-phosphate mutarotase [Entomospira entomophilus]WDI35843.1 D-hexose-6-phosphate mutarotase [Entomospira entomophilus]
MIKEFQTGGQQFIQLENSHYEVLISAYGAQVLALQPKNDSADWLWLSEQSPIIQGKAVRGGIPICWPNFGKDSGGKLPKHGFARLQNWRFKGEQESEREQSVAVSFILRDNAFSRQYWSYAFELEMAIRLTTAGLECELTTTNKDVVPFQYNEAFHPYFHVSNIKNIRVHGLDGCAYTVEESGETGIWRDDLSCDAMHDNTFFNIENSLRLEDSGWSRSLMLDKSGASDWVMWNPHAQGAREIADMADDSYQSMICLEPATIERKELLPGESATMRMVLRI